MNIIKPSLFVFKIWSLKIINSTAPNVRIAEIINLVNKNLLCIKDFIIIITVINPANITEIIGDCEI